MKKFFVKKRLIVTLPALVLVLYGGVFWYAKQAQGVTRTWDGGGGDANWNTAANWSGDTVPDRCETKGHLTRTLV